MPAPHSPEPVPGLAQVSVPSGTTFQPFAFSRLVALRRAERVGVGRRVLWQERARRVLRDRPVRLVAVAVEVGLDLAGLVLQVLHRLPEVQLAGDGVKAARRVLEVVGHEVVAEVRQAVVVVAEPLQLRDLRVVFLRDVTEVDRPGLDRVPLRRVRGERHADVVGLGGRVRPAVGGVGHHGERAGGVVERAQLVRPVDGLPQRVRRVGGHRLGLRGQEGKDLGRVGRVREVESRPVRGVLGPFG